MIPRRRSERSLQQTRGMTSIHDKSTAVYGAYAVIITLVMIH